MLEIAQALYLTDILHLASQSLLAPIIVILLIFLGYALFLIGSLLVEAITEQRNFRVETPRFLASLAAASEDEVADCIIDAGLLRRQKVELLTLWGYRDLPPSAAEALAKRLLAIEQLRYDRITGRTDSAARLAPMAGLMGTLIPLGPGIVALGQGDTATLAASIGVAFDTTVAGLAAAAVAFVASRIRRNWYEDYLGASEAALSTLLERAESLRGDGGGITPGAVDIEAIVARAQYEMRAAGVTLKELAGAHAGADGPGKASHSKGTVS